MEREIKTIIHAFRNALVMASDTHSHACFFMPRWHKELNGFPSGSCDLASNFLAKYLTEHGYPAWIIRFSCSPEINKYIKTHVVVKYDDYYIDLTRNQFADYNSRVLIEDKYGSIATLLRDVKKEEFLTFKEEDFCIDNATDSGEQLYCYVKQLADGLVKK